MGERKLTQPPHPQPNKYFQEDYQEHDLGVLSGSYRPGGGDQVTMNVCLTLCCSVRFPCFIFLVCVVISETYQSAYSATQLLTANSYMCIKRRKK